MKKNTCVTLFFILLLILSLDWFNHTSYRALKISDDCKIGIDINNNNRISEEEFFSLDKITTFCTFDSISSAENKIGKLNKKQKIYLSLKTKELFLKTFLTSLIRIDKNKITTNFQDPNILFLSQGLAVSNSQEYDKYENLDAINKLKSDAINKNIVILNTKSLKYHKLDCEKGLNSKQKIYLLFEELPSKAKPCKYCHNLNTTQSKNIENKNIVTELTDKKEVIQIYQTIGYGATKPSSKCTTQMCKSLKNEINSAEKSIDMAIYDFLNQPELLSALQNAKNRGVKIRVAIDNKNYNENIYTQKALKSFASNIYDDSANQKEAFRLMHNKFIVFDNKKVWTGTANLTDTCLSGFNANITMIINSAEIASLYEEEFENFVNGKFHSSKNKIQTKEFKTGNLTITPYFSPKDKTIQTQIIPELKKATKYIYIPSFITTHTGIETELIKAKQRGVDVRLITDATSARNKYSIHSNLRKNDISVKTENFAGKMHTKAVIIDDRIAFVGSMNLTKSGNVYNDENCVKIENPEVVSEMKKAFITIWNSIPDKYLKIDPKAESFESTGSCFDGVDNDFDGKIDFADTGCQINTGN